MKHTIHPDDKSYWSVTGVKEACEGLQEMPRMVFLELGYKLV